MAISERIINLLDGYSLLHKGRVAERLRQMTPQSRQRVLNEIAAYYLSLKPEAILEAKSERGGGQPPQPRGGSGWHHPGRVPG